MKLRYDVYIAGSMHGRRVGDVLAERALAKAFCGLYGLTYYCPAADEGLDKKERNDIIDLVPDLDLMESYVKKDDHNLDKCRVLLVLTGDKSSSGTAWEMARMHYKNKRKIVIVANRMWYGKLVNFTTIKANYIRPTIESAIRSIANILHGG